MPRAFKAGDLIFLGAVLAVMIALTTVSFVIAPPQSQGLRASTYSARSSGAKAVFVVLKQLGYRIERSFAPISALHTKPAETILVIASPTRRASLQDRRELRSFVEAGGVVIATGGGGSFLPEMASVSLVEDSLFGRRPAPKPAGPKQPAQPKQSEQSEQSEEPDGPLPWMPDSSPPVVYHVAAPSPRTRGTPTVLLESEIFGAAPTPDSYVPLYTSPDGPGVLAATFGDGHVLWLIGSTPFLNGSIDKPGQLEFVLTVIGSPGEQRLVLWDEYYHGYDRGLISYLATSQLSTAFGQLALMGALALFTYSRRRGPLRPLPVRPRASAMEFVDAVSALYQKARASDGAVETMRARLRRVLITTLQVPANSSDAQLAAAAAARHAIDERDLRDLLTASADAGRQASLPADEALSLVRRMQAVVRKVLE